MATFNVFVEGPVGSMGLPELANAMSQRYGLPAVELVTRLQRGRFRVKSNLDAPTAERYRRDLEAIGAIVVVEDAAKSPTATPVAGVPVLPVQSRAPALSLPPVVAVQASAVPPTQDPRTFTILGPQHTRDPGRSDVIPTIREPAVPNATLSGPQTVREPARAGNTDAPFTRDPRAGSVSSPPGDPRPNRAGTASAAQNRTGAPPSRAGTASSPPNRAPIREVVRPGSVSSPPSDFREVMRPGSVSTSPDDAPTSDAARPGGPQSVLPARAPGQPSVAPQSVLPARAPGQPSVAPQSVLPARAPGQPSMAPQSVLPPRGAQPSMVPPSSGLAAAYTPASGHADLGALSSENSFSLASLDGHDDPTTLPPVAVVNIKPNATDAPRAKPSPSKPMDLFAPPDAGDQELAVELADDEIAERAAKRASIPPATQPTPSLLPSHRLATSQSQPLALPNEGGTSAVAKPFSREQFAIGVVLALVIGFLPAHFVASSRETTAFATLDGQLLEMQSGMDTPDTYAMIDAARAKFLDAKDAKRSSIALQSMLLWAAVSAGVGFAFFRLRKS
jgi:hypothetical protein